MNSKHLLQISLVALSILALTSVAMAEGASNQGSDTNLIETVRKSTERYQALADAETDGYGLFHGCVSGPQQGAMGVHFVKGDLVGDGEVDAVHPEALLYEMKRGEMQLAGVEYVVMAEDWAAKHDTPPVLMGNLFNYVGSPNRYGLPAFYELHVWAWKRNPDGTFADYNPLVSCDEFTGDSTMPEGHHG